MPETAGPPKRQPRGAGSHRLLAALLGLVLTLPGFGAEVPRHRVIVSTDIGGTDPDDFQSLVHLLLYADTLDLEGLVSSPFGPGRKQDILDVIGLYERDFAGLRACSGGYPTAAELRSMTKQGGIGPAPYRGFHRATEGSRWIVERARSEDPRPLHILVWGGIEDLAQALHDAPEILRAIRVYYIGGPNKKWSPNAYQYVADRHRGLRIIEANATYRGWFVGGMQSGEWSNRAFVSAHIAGRGALGNFFAAQLDGSLKMGDSPSVGWLLHGTPGDPSQPGWGGQFVRAWTRPQSEFHRLTTRNDAIDEFGIFELALPLGPGTPKDAEAQMHIENQVLDGWIGADARVRFRFSPKEARVFRYAIRSNVASLDGKTGELTARPTPAARAPDPKWPNWWTDNPAPDAAEPPHIGAKTVNRWRVDFLADFADRIDRCLAPAVTDRVTP